MVRPAERRRVAEWAQSAFRVSERRACSTVGVGRSCVRNKSWRPRQELLRMRLRELAAVRTYAGFCRQYTDLGRAAAAVSGLGGSAAIWLWQRCSSPSFRPGSRTSGPPAGTARSHPTGSGRIELVMLSRRCPSTGAPAGKSRWRSHFATRPSGSNTCLLSAAA